MIYKKPAQQAPNDDRPSLANTTRGLVESTCQQHWSYPSQVDFRVMTLFNFKQMLFAIALIFFTYLFFKQI